MASNKFKIILWSLGIIMLIFLGFFLYQLTQSESVNSIMILLMLLLGLILGGVIAFLASKKLVSEPSVITESSHTIAESMRKVFKVVSAEGHFNEIYNYEETTKLFNFIPSKKKALVIVQAKVLVGYDFEKFQWEVDEQNRKVRLLNFPAPEFFPPKPITNITISKNSFLIFSAKMIWPKFSRTVNNRLLKPLKNLIFRKLLLNRCAPCLPNCWQEKTFC